MYAAPFFIGLEHKLDSGSIKTSPRDVLRAIGKETTPNCATLGHSNPRMWHRALKKVMCGDDHKDVIEVESIKDLPDTEQVELIAEKFAEVANLYEPLDRTKISVPEFQEKDVPVPGSLSC